MPQATRGASLLSSEHTCFLVSGEPVRYGIVLFHGDRYQFSVETPIQVHWGRGGARRPPAGRTARARSAEAFAHEDIISRYLA